MWFKNSLYVWQTHMCVHVRHPYSHSILLFEVVVTETGEPVWARLAASETQGSLCLHFSSPGIINICHSAWFFMWVLGIWIHALILAKQTIYLLRHVSSSSMASYPLKMVLSLLKHYFSLLLNAYYIFLFFCCSLWKKKAHITHILFLFPPPLFPPHSHHHFAGQFCLEVTR